MRKQSNFAPVSSAIAAKTDGNPEGKGCDVFMLDWQRSEPHAVVAKPQRQLLAEFFTSMLVLSSTFKFRPVVDAPHYLYWINNEWNLSLVAPYEWSDARRSAYAGTCVLHRDMTWTIDLSDSLTQSSPVYSAIGRFYDAFASTLDTDQTLEDILPFYVGSMPYYQKLYANALSRSMRGSMMVGDQTNNSGKAWRGLLPILSNTLLEHRSYVVQHAS